MKVGELGNDFRDLRCKTSVALIGILTILYSLNNGTFATFI
jgi:hypothetical protein